MSEFETVLAVIERGSRFHDLRIVAIELGWTLEKVRAVLGLKIKLQS